MKPLSIGVLLFASLGADLPPYAQAEPQRSSATRPDTAHPGPHAAQATALMTPDVRIVTPETPLKSLLVDRVFGAIGYPNGFRLSNLGGRREIYIPVPQGIELSPAALVLVLDDFSAHQSRRSLEILVNDRSVFATALDGKQTGYTVRIPLTNAVAQDGFLKLTFLYSGAATQDRCIDVRYVGDSVTVRPESSVEFEVGIIGPPNITATAALLPQNVAILLSNPQLAPIDIAAALTLARSLAAAGRHVTFYHGIDSLEELAKREDKRKWTRGLVIVGVVEPIADRLDTPIVTLAAASGSRPAVNNLLAARIGGMPVLLVTDPASARAGGTIGNPALAALRDTQFASVGQVTLPKGRTDHISFDELGLVPAQADVFGRADLSVAIPSRSLPAGTRPSRMILDVMVAPDGAGEKAVVSVFVNERLLASSVAAIGEPTRLDIPLPEGLVGSAANIRAVVQRRSSQGDCRFEPQGYPAEILGSSSIVLSTANAAAGQFSDLSALWANGVELLVPSSAATHPLKILALLADILNGLTKETAPIDVKFVDTGLVPGPSAPFIAVGNVPPAGAKERVRFDRGRVAVTDRMGQTRLDIGGLTTGAVAQIVTSGSNSGLWIKPLTTDGSLPISPAAYLDHGDVAFLDKTGVALALSTQRDTLLQISYSGQESWFSILKRFGSWVVVGVWALLTIVVLVVLQRFYRRRTAAMGD